MLLQGRYGPATMLWLRQQLADEEAYLVKLGGSEAIFACRLDESEHSRRESERLGALDDRDLVRCLHSLPVDEAISVDSLTNREARALRRSRQGVAIRQQHTVTRLVRSPLVDVIALYEATSVSTGLTKLLNEVPPVARRILVLPPHQRADETLLLEASYHNVGVVTVSDASVDVLVRVESGSIRRGPVRWSLEEKLYAQLLEGSARLIQT